MCHPSSPSPPPPPQLAWVLFLLSVKSAAHRERIARLRRTTLLPLAQQLENAEASQSSMLRALEMQQEEQEQQQQLRAAKVPSVFAITKGGSGNGPSGVGITRGGSAQQPPPPPPQQSGLGDGGLLNGPLPISTRAAEGSRSQSFGGELPAHPTPLADAPPDSDDLPATAADDDQLLDRSPGPCGSGGPEHGDDGNSLASTPEEPPPRGDTAVDGGSFETPTRDRLAEPFPPLSLPGGGECGGSETASSTSSPMVAQQRSRSEVSPQVLGGEPSSARRTLSDDDDWELAMIRKEVAMLARSSLGAAAGNSGGASQRSPFK